VTTRLSFTCSYTAVGLYLYIEEYDGSYFVFAVKCFALSLMNVKQMVTMIQIRYADTNTPLQFSSSMTYATQLDAMNKNAIL
jgi:hypothetical protein